MFSKLQILHLVIFCALFATSNAQTVNPNTSPPKLVVDDYYYSGNVDGNVKHNYIVLRTFIVNHSKDTLKYWGTMRQFRVFFDVKGSDELHVANPDVNGPMYEPMIIPPHHSQRLSLRLSITKAPKGVVNLTVDMRFYRWFPTKDLSKDILIHQPEMLSDNITLTFKEDGSDIIDVHAERGEKEQKAKLILPTTDLYELTKAERKNYTLTVDEKKIKKAPKTDYNYKTETVILIPVVVHNKGKDTLNYFSMTCSGLDYYHINNKKFSVLYSSCSDNLPKQITIMPKASRLVTIPVIYRNKEVKNHEPLKIGLNINKNVNPNPFDFDADELTRYNVVWSNDLRLAVQ
jgi:hypothetical protein